MRSTKGSLCRRHGGGDGKVNETGRPDVHVYKRCIVFLFYFLTGDRVIFKFVPICMTTTTGSHPRVLYYIPTIIVSTRIRIRARSPHLGKRKKYYYRIVCMYRVSHENVFFYDLSRGYEDYR